MATKQQAPQRPAPAPAAKRSMSEMARLMHQKAVAPKGKGAKGK